MSAGTEQQLLL